MIMEHKYIRHTDCFEVIVSGNFFIYEAVEKFAMLLNCCKLAGVGKVLIDYREMKNMPGGTLRQLYNFGMEDKYRQYLIEGGTELQFANIFCKETEKQSRAEAEAGLLSMEIRSFSDVKEAYGWLAITPSSERVHKRDQCQSW